MHLTPAGMTVALLLGAAPARFWAESVSDSTVSTACSGRGGDDSSEPRCEPWCADLGHCSWCKCAGCSMCTKKCEPASDDDVAYERCEEWCGASEHCGLCKCRGCDVCRGHHPDVPCVPAAPGDVGHVDCQAWCEKDAQHCGMCKCKGCAKCRQQPAPCAPVDALDSSVALCEGWCGGEKHCGNCKCAACTQCPRCESWCAAIADCNALACKGCPVLCKDVIEDEKCRSGLPNDTPTKQCGGFCSATFAKDHCRHCGCQRCDFCAGNMLLASFMGGKG